MNYFVDSGSSFLVIACLLSLLYPLVAHVSVRLGSLLTYSVSFAHSLAFAFLVYLRVTDNFSFLHVYNNSHSLQPLLFKIFGVWGNYEGSSLLFTWMLSTYAVIIDIIIKEKSTKTIALSVQHLLVLGFTFFSTVLANPFEKILTMDNNGLGFNPMLQDVAITIHPPVLFAGYAGFSAVLSITIAALVLRTDPKKWSTQLMGWTLSSWSFLTAGIALGGWWAYRELGWGGFWSWDPVENVVLMPWLIGTALIHMLPVVKRYGIYCNVTFFLALLVFVTSLYSMFLVRSGLLISVHTFASDTYRGVFLLVLVSTIAAICLITFIVFYRGIEESCPSGYMSKITAIVGNNVLMLTAFSVVLVGTMYPIIHEFLAGEIVSVGAQYYTNAFSALTGLLLVVMILLSGLSWEGEKKFSLSFKISAFFSMVFLPLAISKGVIGILLLLSAFLFFSIVEDFFTRSTSSSFLQTFYKVGGWKRLSMLAGHLGIAVLVFGIVYSNVFQEEATQYMKIGESVNIHGFELVLDDVELTKKEYYEAIRGKLKVVYPNKNRIVHLFPENRFYHVESTKNAESSIHHGTYADIYVVVGDVDPKRGIAVRIHYKPLMMLVWIGSALIVLGGILGIAVILLNKYASSKCNNDRNTVSALTD